jgi:hypothetical protein
MATSQGILNKQYVSSLDSFLDTREINKLVTDVQNEDNLTDILQLASRKKPIATGQPFYNTYVNDKLFFLLDTTGGTVNGSGTVSVNFTCTAATSGLVRKDDIVLAPTGVISCIVTNVISASGIDTVYVKSVSGANITLTAGQKLSVYSVAVGENSVSQSNLRFGLTRYFNKYQIFREISIVTDVQTAATIETTFNGQPYFAVKDHLEKQIKLKGDINAAFIAGDMSSTSFADTTPFLTDANTSNGNGGGAVQTTRGIHKYIELYGNTIVDGTAGTFGKSDLDNAVSTLIASRAPKEQLVFGSSASRAAIDTYYKNLGSAGVTSVRLVVDGKELDLNVDKVSYAGFQFNYMTMPIQDHPVMFSQTVINSSVYYLPYNLKVPVQGGGFDAAVAVRYIPSQTKYGNGMIDEIHTGALAWNGIPNGDFMNATTSWTTKQGLEVLGAQFMLRQQI